MLIILSSKRQLWVSLELAEVNYALGHIRPSLLVLHHATRYRLPVFVATGPGYVVVPAGDLGNGAAG